MEKLYVNRMEKGLRNLVLFVLGFAVFFMLFPFASEAKQAGKKTVGQKVEVMSTPVQIIVDSTGDSVAKDGACTLREAINNANAGGDTSGGDCGTGSRIGFASYLAGQTISLSGVDDRAKGLSAIKITGSVAIIGDSIKGMTIARDGAATKMRLFYVTGSGRLELENVTLADGYSKGGNGGRSGGGGGGAFGGAIFNEGALVIRNSTLKGNIAEGGDGGTRISDSFGGGGGGGMAGDGGISPSSLDAMRPGAAGGEGGGGTGGMGTNKAAAAATNGLSGTFGGGGGGGGNANNGCGGAGGSGGFGGGGGGIGLSNSSTSWCSDASLQTGGSSTFGGGKGEAGRSGGTGGGGAGLGGAIYSASGSVTMTNTTLSANQAIGGQLASGADTQGAGLGGAIFVYQGTVTMVNSTVAYNQTKTSNPAYKNEAAGIYVYLGQFNLSNSIIANNQNNDTGNQDIFNRNGSVSGSHNLVQKAGNVGAGVILLSNDPKLAPLADNEGPAYTHALGADSPAIKSGDAAGTPETDQRGIMRTMPPDLGSFEWVASTNNTKTTLTMSPGSGNVGDAVTATVKVEAVAPWKTPVGSVTVSDGDMSCTATLVNGTGTCSLVFTTPGNKSLVANYAGGSGFNGSVSATVSFTVFKKSAVTSVVAPTPLNAEVGKEQSFTFQVKASPAGSGTPTGEWTIKPLPSGTSCTTPVAADGTGTCKFTFQSAGTVKLEVRYSGDATFYGTTYNFDVTVAKAKTKVTILSQTPGTSVIGGKVTFQVKAEPANGTGNYPSGTVVVGTGGENCTATLANGVGTCDVTFNTAGLKWVQAYYNGDGNYEGNSSPGFKYTVAKGETNTTITEITPSPAAVGQSVKVGVEVTTTAQTGTQLTGSVTISNGENSCFASLVAGKGSCELSSSSIGTKEVTATYSGDSNFLVSSISRSHTVQKAETTTTLVSRTPASSVTGETVKAEVEVKAVYGGSLVPGGTVTISSESGQESCTATLVNGKGACNLVFAKAGTYKLTAVYNGDTNFNNSTSEGVNHSVAKAQTTTAILKTTLVDDTLSVDVEVAVQSPGQGMPTGAVAVRAGTKTCSVVLANGKGSCSLTYSRLGGEKLQATYAGDADLLASDSLAFVAPKVEDGALSTTRNKEQSGSLSGSDENADALTYSIMTAPGKGKVVITNPATGEFIYTPTKGETGADSFTFQASDGMLVSNIATVSVQIANTTPQAQNKSVTTTRNKAVTDQLSGSDGDGDSLTYAIQTNGDKGTAEITDPATGAFTYTPKKGETGTDTFTYLVHDGVTTSEPATVTITITNNAPQAAAMSITAARNKALSGEVRGTDADADKLIYQIVSNGTKGTAIITDPATGAFVYTPSPGEAGADSFTFIANDGLQDSQAATVAITIENTVPQVDSGKLATTRNKKVQGKLKGSDENGDSLTYQIADESSKGTVTITDPVTGAFTYTPAPGETGEDSFSVTASDGLAVSVPATITVTISNTVPKAESTTFKTVRNKIIKDKLKATDEDGDNLVYEIFANGNLGEAVLDDPTTGAFTYTPNRNVLGEDHISFRVSDGLDSAEGVIKVLIRNNPPVYIPVTGVKLDRKELELTVGAEAIKLKATVEPDYATNVDVNWASSDTKVATVNEDGVVTPLAAGKAIITVTTVDGNKMAETVVYVKESVEVRITGLKASATSLLLEPRKSKNLKIYATYSDGTQREITNATGITYKSSSTAIATVKNGKVNAGRKQGDARMIVTYEGVRMDIPVTVSTDRLKELTLPEQHIELKPEEERQLQATAFWSKQKQKDVTDKAVWYSSNPDVVTVESGKLIAHGEGIATITVVYGGKESKLEITVGQTKELKRLTVSKRSVKLREGETENIRLTAYYKDGTKEDVTKKAEWRSEDETVVSVKAGAITAIAKGTTTITVTSNGQTLTLKVTVSK